MAQQNIFPTKYIFLLLVILSITLLSKITIFNHIYSISPETVIQSDTRRYEEPALQFLNEGTLAIDPHSPQTTTLSTTPIYSLYIAGIYKVMGEKDHHAVVISQIFLSTLTALILFLIAHKLWTPRASLIVLSLMVLEPLQTLYAQMILSETLFIFFLACSLLSFIYLLSSQHKYKWAFALGAMLTLATMTRPISYYLVFSILVGLIIFKQRISQTWPQIMSISLLILLPFILVTSSWKARNESLTGLYVLNDAMSETMLYYKAKGVLMVGKSLSDEEAQQEILKRLPAKFETPKERANAETKLAKEIILADIGSYFKLSLEGIKAIVLGPGLISQAMFYDYHHRGIKSQTSDNKEYKLWYLLLIIYGFGFIVVTYLFSAYGFLRAFKESKQKNTVIHFLMLGTILYFVLISTGHTAADSRMRTPIIPIILLYASYGLAKLIGKIQQAKQSNKTSEKI